VRACVAQTREEAYAHHIQRLMVTGNFALIAGIDPFEIHEWYLAVYADAYEWEELPNTLGMSLRRRRLAWFQALRRKWQLHQQDVGLMQRLRVRCEAAHRAESMPFQLPLLGFPHSHQKLGRNPRLRQVYRAADAMSDAKQEEIRASAATFLDSLKSSYGGPAAG
jgi:deoxyribodipyrimidine photolyase-related protein